MITGLPTAPLASRLINQRAAAPWITLPRRASLIDSKILSKQTEPALTMIFDVVNKRIGHLRTGSSTEDIVIYGVCKRRIAIRRQ